MTGLIASNAYVIESDEGLVVYDPSCGARVAKEIATLIEQRGPLENLWVIIGHSHFDHAANLHVADHGTVARRHIIAHEAGFVGDTIANSAEQTYRSGIRKAQATYDPYRAAFGATRAIQAPFALTHTVAPALTESVFVSLVTLRAGLPTTSKVMPRRLTDSDAQLIDLDGVAARGWSVDGLTLLATPGHSPCSISLFDPQRRVLCTSDADWIGNPVGPPGSLRACVESLEMMVALVRAGQVEFLLPGHGLHVTGADAILCHLQSRVELLRTLRQEVLNGWRQHGGEPDVTILTRWLVERSPLFRLWSHAAFPKHVVFPFNMVSIVLTEEGLLPQCDQLS
jgi:glyoxylase-like metal-dependent hydrolase (beta-lactamase superfamily II)